MPARDRGRRLRERVIEPGDHLRHRQVRVRQLRSDEPAASAGVALEHRLEVTEKFRQPVVEEVPRAALRRLFLLLVVQAAADRVMRVVNLVDEVGDRQLELMRPEPAVVVVRRQPQPGAEIQQDVRGLADRHLAVLQKRRRERRSFDARAGQHALQRRHAAAFRLRQPRDVHVVGARVLEREPHELAAPLDPGPVVELVCHTPSACVACVRIEANTRLPRS